jgi:hypothetical protein
MGHHQARQGHPRHHPKASLTGAGPVTLAATTLRARETVTARAAALAIHTRGARVEDETLSTSAINHITVDTVAQRVSRRSSDFAVLGLDYPRLLFERVDDRVQEITRAWVDGVDRVVTVRRDRVRSSIRNGIEGAHSLGDRVARFARAHAAHTA